MKLSEAILKGCENTRKGVGAFPPDGGRCCCVLEAAYRGLKGKRDLWREMSQVLEDKYPFLDNECDQSPLGLTLWGEIVRRNDKTDSSREDIAAWLAGLGL